MVAASRGLEKCSSAGSAVACVSSCSWSSLSPSVPRWLSGADDAAFVVASDVHCVLPAGAGPEGGPHCGSSGARFTSELPQ